MARKAGDIYIDNQPLRISSYQRGTTDDMVARFGSSEKGQTNLDLFKAATQKGWRGGMFQKNWSDDEMAGYISGLHHNSLDGKLYLTPEMEQNLKTNGGMTPNGITAWCFFNGLLYIAFSLNSPSTDTNGLVKINLDTNTVTGITLPAAIKGASVPITSMVTHGTAIFLAGKSRATGSDLSFNVHRFDGNTTFVSLGSASTYRFLVSFNDRLYGMGVAEFHLITDEFTSVLKRTKIKTVGADEPGVNSVHKVIEYNGAVYIAKSDGLFRYNGIDIYTVLNHRNNVSPENFKNLTVFNGRLYWSVRGRIYEFDGVNVTQVVDMSDAYQIIDMAGGDDRLWVSVRYNATSSSIFESGNFTDPIVVQTYTYGLFSYNGVGFFEYKNFTYTNDQAHGDYGLPIQFNGIPVDGYITWFYPRVYYNASLETRSEGWAYFKQELATEFQLDQIGDSRTSTIIGSVLDAGYPSVPKTLNGVMAEYEGFTSDVLMTVEIRKNYAGSVSAWIEVFRTDNVAVDGATNDYYLHDEVIDVGALDLETEPHIFHRIEYKITITVTDELTEIPKLQSLTKRYTLQPRMRRQWVLGVSIFGTDTANVDVQFMGDGTAEARKAHELRKIIYDAYENKLPILFYDLDYSEILDDSPLQIKGQNWIKDGDYIAIETTAGDTESWVNRRIQVASVATDYTQVTLDDIGHRESIGAADSALVSNITVGDQVRKSYAVYVRRIQQERVIIDDNTVNDEGGYSDYSSELVIELIEA